MTTIKFDRFLRIILPPYLIFLFLNSATNSYLSYLRHHGHIMGDWLINYQGGMVRRGMIGEIIYQLSLYTSVSPGLLVVIVHMLSYLIFFTFSYLLLKRQALIYPYVLLIFSPFILSFQVNDFLGGFRKEIIFFAILSLVAWISVAQSTRRFEISFLIILSLFPLVVLSHEQLAVLFPYLLIVYLSKIRLTSKKAGVLVILSSLSVLAFLACCYYSGSATHIEDIQKSLTLIGYEVGDGSITWLGQTIYEAMVISHFYIKHHNYLLYYTFILFLSIIAYIPILGRIEQILCIPYSKILISIPLLGTVPLIIVTLDWGRLLYIHLVSVFILSLIVKNGSSKFTKFVAHKLQYSDDFVLKPIYRNLIIVFIILYSFTWYIPHYKPDWFYVNFPKTTIGRIIIPYIVMDNYLSK